MKWPCGVLTRVFFWTYQRLAMRTAHTVVHNINLKLANQRVTIKQPAF